MDTTNEANGSTPSTTWEWRTIRIARAPQASRTVAEGRRWFSRLPSRNPREPLTLKVKYRGGSECWYEIRARGGVIRIPGVTALHDVMVVLNQAK